MTRRSSLEQDYYYEIQKLAAEFTDLWEYVNYRKNFTSLTKEMVLKRIRTIQTIVGEWQRGT